MSEQLAPIRQGRARYLLMARWRHVMLACCAVASMQAIAAEDVQASDPQPPQAPSRSWRLDLNAGIRRIGLPHEWGSTPFSLALGVRWQSGLSIVFGGALTPEVPDWLELNAPYHDQWQTGYYAFYLDRQSLFVRGRYEPRTGLSPVYELGFGVNRTSLTFYDVDYPSTGYWFATTRRGLLPFAYAGGGIAFHATMGFYFTATAGLNFEFGDLSGPSDANLSGVRPQTIKRLDATVDAIRLVAPYAGLDVGWLF